MDQLHPRHVQCPLCLDNNNARTIRVATDACFQLKNLQQPEGDTRPALFGDEYFMDRPSVERRVAEGDHLLIKSCNHRAGDGMKLPSAAGLDVTAVMSTVCEHELFVTSLCLSRGEKFAYPAILLNNVCEKAGDESKIISYYDINCTFSKYWKVRSIGLFFFMLIFLATKRESKSYSFSNSCIPCAWARCTVQDSIYAAIYGGSGHMGW